MINARVDDVIVPIVKTSEEAAKNLIILLN
jgi:hypothetical protein